MFCLKDLKMLLICKLDIKGKRRKQTSHGVVRDIRFSVVWDTLTLYAGYYLLTLISLLARARDSWNVLWGTCMTLVNFFWVGMIPRSIRICVPNLVAVRRPCRKKGVPSHRHTEGHCRMSTCIAFLFYS